VRPNRADQVVTAPQKTGNIQFLILAEEALFRSTAKGICLHLLTLVSQLTRSRSAVSLFPRSMAVSPLAILGVLTLFEASKKGDMYNILWALVFGFATINILSLVSRRIDPNRHNRMSFGEMMAVGTVAVAVILLGWEMLSLFKIFPIRLSSH
jgi:hypothetical protein